MKTTCLCCLVAVTTAANGCDTSVPAPWNEWGVPGDWLTEIAAGTSSERYIATYDQDPRGVVSSFRTGLAKGGFSNCGEVVIDGAAAGRKEGSPPFQATGFLKKDGAIWRIRALMVNAERTSVRLEKIPAETLSHIEAQQAAQQSGWKAWHSQLARSGCLSLSKTTKAAVPAAVRISARSKAPPTIQRADAGAGPRHRTRRRRVTSQAREPASVTRTNVRLPRYAQQVVQRSSRRIRFCYENARRTNPALRGNVVVKFIVGPSGAVTTVSDAGSDIADPAVVSCVLKCFKRMRFPEPNATFVYPIRFDST